VDQALDRLQVVLATDRGRVLIDGNDEGGDEVGGNCGLNEPEVLALPTPVRGNEGRLGNDDQSPGLGRMSRHRWDVT
jgi:hypothetical protein